jgi:hypothetical protein
MNAYKMTHAIKERLEKRGIVVTWDDVWILRRIERTLHTWGEQECGDSNDYQSWSIERDELTGKPFRCVYPHQGEMRKYAIPDREQGALVRVHKLCQRLDLYFYHQTDPRGCALYISKEPLTDANYTNGVAISI